MMMMSKNTTSPIVSLFTIIFTFVILVLNIFPSIVAEEDQKIRNNNNDELMEPDVRRYEGVLPRDVCSKLIELGEKVGFPMEFDSIDAYVTTSNSASQAIDVVNEDGSVNYPDLWEVVKPFVPKIANLISKQRDETTHRKFWPDEPDRPPKLGWVFYRKYSPDSNRNSLLPHTDTNLHTVNIALNDDFEGGGIFYFKPPFSIYDEDLQDVQPNRSPPEVPQIDEEYYNSYDVVNSISSNTSEVVFPMMKTGDAIIHNYTVWHAVAPLQKGIRYSMVLFFDMDNPMLDRNDDDDKIVVTMKNYIHGCDNDGSKSNNSTIDIVWIGDDYGLDEFVIMERRMKHGRSHPIGTYPGNVFQAVKTGTHEVLAEIEVQDNVFDYEFVRQNKCSPHNNNNDDDEL